MVHGKRGVMVGSRWQWVADGGAVLLGNAIIMQIGRCLYDGGLKVAVGCRGLVVVGSGWQGVASDAV